jgi:hypothetical protein
MMQQNEYLVTLDNDNVISVLKATVIHPDEKSRGSEEDQGPVIHLPSVGIINESKSIKTPNRGNESQ